MDVIGVKVLSGFLFFFLVILFGWFPFWLLKRCSRSEGRVSSTSGQKLPLVHFLHSMASGVLIATCLLSLLPEAIEAVHKAFGSSHTLQGREAPPPSNQGNDSNINITSSGSKSSTEEIDNVYVHHVDTTEEVDKGTYPLAELLVALGFLSIYILDSSLKAAQRSWGGKGNSKNIASDEVVLFQKRKRSFDQDENSEFDRWKATPVRDSRYSDNDPRSPTEDSYSQNTSIPTNKRSKWFKPKFSNNFEPQLERQSSEEVATAISLDDDVREIVWPGSESAEEHPLAERRQHQAASANSKSVHLRSAALVGALCVHGFFDGLLLGLQTSVHVLLSLLLALSIHKSFVSLSLSLTLFNHHVKDSKVSRVFLYIFLFALVAPFGLAMSAGFVHGTFTNVKDGSGESSSGLLPGCLQAFAVGTFMYVAFTETTEHHHDEHQQHGSSLIRHLVSHVFLLLGFSAMAGLRAALGEV